MKNPFSRKRPKPSDPAPSIPVFQILIAEPGDIPDAIRASMETAKAHLGRTNYTLYDDATLLAFIEKHFPPSIAQAYRSLKPNAYRADLGRLCLLYVHGGWYSDITIRWVSPFEMPEDADVLVFRDRQRYSLTNWACSNSIIYARQGQKVLQTAIEMIEANVRERYYGITPLCPTGPSVLGRALAMHGPNLRTLYGDFIPLTPEHEIKNNAYVLPNGEILAFSKRGSLQNEGLKTGNSYVELWHARDVYV